MEDEIDLRVYVLILFRHWPWIVGLAVVFAAVAFVVSSTQPATYEASAVVLITEPRYQLQFDARFSTEETQPAPKAFPILAKSDSVLQSVVDAYVPPPAAGIEAWNLTTLSRMVHASSEGDPTLMVLTVTSRSPEAAAGIANRWAGALVARGNAIYSGGEEDVVFFEQQLAQAEEMLSEAESAMIDFEARNQTNMLQADLRSVSSARDEYLASQRSAARLIGDLRSLRNLWGDQPEGKGSPIADGLTALLLQIRAFNGQLAESSASQVPITFQISDQDAFMAQSREEQVALLDRLVSTVEQRSSEIESALAGLEPQVLSLQHQIQVLEVEDDRLTRDHQLARDTYLTLARKLDEAHIAMQEETGSLQVGSQAAVPERPTGPRRLFNTVVGTAVGGMLGVVVAFAIGFWRQGRAGETNPASTLQG